MFKCKLTPNADGIELAGPFDAASVPQFEKTAEELKPGEVLLFFSGITEIGEEALRAILLLSRRIRKAGGSVKIVAPSPAIREYFVQEGYHLLLEIR
jgi:anti-anti-sigma regulatory factor